MMIWLASISLCLWLAGMMILKSEFDVLEHNIDSFGVADERHFWSESTGLWIPKDGTVPDHAEAFQGIKDGENGIRFSYRYIIGMYAYYIGREAHVIDRCALTDPILARLPISNPNEWRIGHFERDAPAGYQEALAGIGTIENPHLREYWYRLCIVTRTDLWSYRRFVEIWKFNMGQYNYLLEQFIEETGYGKSN
jgi:arabinofuranosyltransferase